MATKHPTSHLTFLGDDHSGRDEMNLAGHPFALLQTPKRQSETSIYYDWERTLANGRVVTASWRVETPAAYGLPGPEEELLYLVLLQLTREAAEAAGTPREWPLVVKFSRRDLLRRLGWSNSAKKYASLLLAFNRLQSVSITARHAFYDARTKSPINAIGFGLLNEFSLVDEPKGRKGQGTIPLSHFEWNTTLHTSFLAGNVRSLSLDFAISLEHPTSRRLFRLLDMLRGASKPPRPQISISLCKLRDRLGMTQYKYPSQIAQKLAPAIEELTARGYLGAVEFGKGTSGEPLATFHFGDVLRAMTPLPAPSSQPAPQNPTAAPQSPAMGFTLPDLGMRPVEIIASAGQEAHNAMLDAAFAELPETEREAIETRALDELMPFLRGRVRSHGAEIELARTRRREVAALLGIHPKIENTSV